MKNELISFFKVVLGVDDYDSKIIITIILIFLVNIEIMIIPMITPVCVRDVKNEGKPCFCTLENYPLLHQTALLSLF